MIRKLEGKKKEGKGDKIVSTSSSGHFISVLCLWSRMTKGKERKRQKFHAISTFLFFIFISFSPSLYPPASSYFSAFFSSLSLSVFLLLLLPFSISEFAYWLQVLSLFPFSLILRLFRRQFPSRFIEPSSRFVCLLGASFGVCVWLWLCLCLCVRRRHLLQREAERIKRWADMIQPEVYQKASQKLRNT